MKLVGTYVNEAGRLLSTTWWDHTDRNYYEIVAHGYYTQVFRGSYYDVSENQVEVETAEDAEQVLILDLELPHAPVVMEEETWNAWKLEMVL